MLYLSLPLAASFLGFSRIVLNLVAKFMRKICCVYIEIELVLLAGGGSINLMVFRSNVVFCFARIEEISLLFVLTVWEDT